jgi:hypothetical protein
VGGGGQEGGGGGVGASRWVGVLGPGRAVIARAMSCGGEASRPAVSVCDCVLYMCVSSQPRTRHDTDT